MVLASGAVLGDVEVFEAFFMGFQESVNKSLSIYLFFQLNRPHYLRPHILKPNLLPTRRICQPIHITFPFLPFIFLRVPLVGSCFRS